MEEISDEELSRKVAIACGLRLDGPGSGPKMWEFFSVSLDACFAPGGPVEYAKAQPIEFRDRYVDELERLVVARGGWDGFVPIEATARDHCLAFLAAVEANA